MGDDDSGMRFELDRLVAYDTQSLLTEVRRVAVLLPDGVISRRDFDALGRVNTSTLIRKFGSWKEVLDRAGLGDRYGGRSVSDKMLDQRARSLTAEDVIAELQRVARVQGTSTITRTDVRRQSDLLGDRVIDNRFGSWRAAVEAAGLDLSPMGRRWTDDDYFENLLEVWTHHGRSPTYGEMNQPPSRITKGAYASKFGTWGKAKAAFVERVNSDIERSRPDHSSEVFPARVSARPRQEDQRSVPIGLRYQVFRRDRFRCVTCGRSPATDLACSLHVDHIVAFSRGGKTRLDNLQSLCAECNVGKGIRD